MNKMFVDHGVLRSGTPPIGRSVSRAPTTAREGLLPNKMKRLVSTSSPRICIIRSLGGIGDVLMTTPAIRALRLAWPKADITYATDFHYMNGALKEILLYNPYITQVIPYNAAYNKDYDYVTDVTPVAVSLEKPKSQVANRIDIFAEHIGVSLDESGYLPDYFITQDETSWAKEKLSRYPSRSSIAPKVGIQVRSSSVSRSWSIDKIQALIALLTGIGIQVVVFDSVFGNGSKQNWNMPGVINLSDYGIRQTAALINEMDLLVCPDSGLMHIAGALNKRIVAIFAGTDPNARINHYPNAVAIAKTEFSCWPCWYRSEACKGSFSCLKGITAEEVVEAVKKQLDKPIMEPKINLCKNVGTGKAICIRRDTGGFGDMACITCVVEDLKDRNKDSNIVVAVPQQYHCIFQNNPAVSKIITREDLSNKDRTLGFIYNFTNIDAAREVQQLMAKKKISLTRPQIYIEATGGSTAGDTNKFVPKLYVTPEEIEQFRNSIGYTNKNVKYILTALDTAEAYRNWPEENYFELFRIAESLHPDWYFIVTSANRIETKLPANVIDITGFSFRKNIIAASFCDAVLTPDTSILHLAAAFKTPCVALFGPIDHKARCKFYQNTRVIRADLKCMPCWRNKVIRCKHETKTHDDLSYCLMQIKPTDVYKVLEDILKDKE